MNEQFAIETRRIMCMTWLQCNVLVGNLGSCHSFGCCLTHETLPNIFYIVFLINIYLCSQITLTLANIVSMQVLWFCAFCSPATLPALAQSWMGSRETSSERFAMWVSLCLVLCVLCHRDVLHLTGKRAGN